MSPFLVSRQLNVSLNIPDQFPTPLVSNTISSLPIPGDPYDPATHGLHNVFQSSSNLSNAFPNMPNALPKNVSQFAHASSAPLHCSSFSIPISCASNPLKSVMTPVPLNDTPASVPIVSVPFTDFSRKGKAKIVVSGTEKRKRASLDDIDPLSPKLQRKNSLLPPRITRSQAKTGVTSVSLSVANAKTAPSSSWPKLKKNYSPILLDATLKADWDVHSKRDLIVEKFINEEDLFPKCNILQLLKDQFLFSSLSKPGSYSAWLTAEFYTNLTVDTFTIGSSRLHRIFIRNRWYTFGPAEINAYLDRPSQVQSADPNLNLLTAVLTHNKQITWPDSGLRSQELTTVYSVLLCLASANWLPVVRVHLISEPLALLLYKIRNRLTFDLGEIIFSHILAYHSKKKEAKIHLPYHCLIYGVLIAQGFRP
ncbi:PREDICTED: uncharacterized protein LOC109149918 [Ipomoea nil]|uniref:uncharacterized protein LOC109149918 n=1 Tax=Ipomoea nil TaxID=35883 RepID=UPI0009020115|nr:PREDICTED: uncharacterized protein LOC109149918 [Ipomoea nil]